jgi:hypothetical protein
LIMESGFIAATNADLLTATRLQTAPANGWMIFQVQAGDNDATNNYKIDLQLPDSDVPMVAQDVPMGATAGLSGQLDDRFMLQYKAYVGKGGRVVFGLTETGDAECTWRVTFQPG